MLVTIRNLPATTRYADLKSLIVSKCGLTEMILDNLTPDGYNSKKVTVGLAEEEDAAIVMRKINGLIIDGHQIFVETVKKKGPPSQPDMPRQPSLQQPYYQQSNYQPSYQQGYNDFQQNVVPTAPYAELYDPANTQNAFANYGYPQQMQYQSNQMVAQSVPTFNQDAPLGFSNQGPNVNVWAHQSDWNPAGSASGGNNGSQQTRINTRWDNSDDNIERSRRDAPARERGRRDDGSSLKYGQHATSRDVGRRPPRDFGRDAQSRGNGRDAQSRGNGRDAQSRGNGRDAPSRDRGRDAPRDNRRDASYRDRRDDRDRNASGRIAPHSRSDSDRGPTKRPFSANNAPGKSSAQLMNKFSQQRDKPGQNWKPQSKPSPNMNRKESAYVPPAKRQRTNAESFNQFDKQASANNDQPLTKKKTKKNDPVTLHNRASTWRYQLASAIAKDILKNPELKNDIDGFLNELKHAVRDRLELLFGDNVKVTQEYMLKVYRKKFSVDTDAEFFQEVTEYVKKHGTTVDKIKKATMADLNIGAAVEKKPPIQQGGKPTVKPGGVKQGIKPTIQQAGVKQEAVAEKENAGGFKIPSYPQGDKKLSKELKKKNQMIFKDTDSLICQLHPNLQKALDEEVEKMGVTITEEFQGEPDPQYKNLHENIKTVVIDNCKQMMKVNVAKRILNMGPIMLRIFVTPKMISRGVLAPILATYGIDSLRKSDGKKTNMYIGSCKSYEIHDKLCAMEPVLVEGSKIMIRPFQLTGTSGKVTKQQIKMQRQHIAEAYSDSNTGMAEQNEEGDEENNLNADDEQDGDQCDDGQLEDDAGEAIDNVDNGNENEPEDQETQETGEYDNAEMADGNNEEEGTELDNENEQVPTGVNSDNLTADSDANEESQINDNSNGKPSESENADQEKDLLKNSEDAEDEPKDYEDIDMDNVNDDDLEDW